VKRVTYLPYANFIQPAGVPVKAASVGLIGFVLQMYICLHIAKTFGIIQVQRCGPLKRELEFVYIIHISQKFCVNHSQTFQMNQVEHGTYSTTPWSKDTLHLAIERSISSLHTVIWNSWTMAYCLHICSKHTIWACQTKNVLWLNHCS